jgi:hypothetical protein
MHDFIQSLAYNGSQPPFAPVVRPAAEPLRGIMRSFDGGSVACRPGLKPAGRRNPKSRILNRK